MLLDTDTPFVISNDTYVLAYGVSIQGYCLLDLKADKHT